MDEREKNKLEAADVRDLINLIMKGSLFDKGDSADSKIKELTTYKDYIKHLNCEELLKQFNILIRMIRERIRVEVFTPLDKSQLDYDNGYYIKMINELSDVQIKPTAFRLLEVQDSEVLRGILLSLQEEQTVQNFNAIKEQKKNEWYSTKDNFKPKDYHLDESIYIEDIPLDVMYKFNDIVGRHIGKGKNEVRKSNYLLESNNDYMFEKQTYNVFDEVSKYSRIINKYYDSYDEYHGLKELILEEAMEKFGYLKYGKHEHESTMKLLCNCYEYLTLLGCDKYSVMPLISMHDERDALESFELILAVINNNVNENMMLKLKRSLPSIVVENKAFCNSRRESEFWQYLQKTKISILGMELIMDNVDAMGEDFLTKFFAYYFDETYETKAREALEFFVKYKGKDINPGELEGKDDEVLNEICMDLFLTENEQRTIVYKLNHSEGDNIKDICFNAFPRVHDFIMKLK